MIDRSKNRPSPPRRGTPPVDGRRSTHHALPADELTVNGEPRRARLSADRALLEVLRADLGLTGAKPGCGEGACGSCTVLLDGEPVRACVTPASVAAGRSVITVEGLAAGGALNPLQQALIAEHAVQCGYCTPGMLLAARALLATNPTPTVREIRAALAGNVCRCGGYTAIVRAIQNAASAMRNEAQRSRAAEDAPPHARSFWQFHAKAPWDLLAPGEREYFELLGDGLVVVLEPGQRERASPRGFAPRSGGAWLHVGADGVVTAFTGKVDVGQDNRTALALIVADELHLAPRGGDRDGRHRSVPV